jgi:hypothetical protein
MHVVAGTRMLVQTQDCGVTYSGVGCQRLTWDKSGFFPKVGAGMGTSFGLNWSYTGLLSSFMMSRIWSENISNLYCHSTPELILSGQRAEQLLPRMWGLSTKYSYATKTLSGACTRDRQFSFKVSRVKNPVGAMRLTNYFTAIAINLSVGTTN